jgi:hypothetical protein
MVGPGDLFTKGASSGKLNIVGYVFYPKGCRQKVEEQAVVRKARSRLAPCCEDPGNSSASGDRFSRAGTHRSAKYLKGFGLMPD